jgi:F-type H+-transporting ATPase subunit a
VPEQTETEAAAPPSKKKLLGLPPPVGYGIILLMTAVILFGIICGPIGTRFGVKLPAWLSNLVSISPPAPQLPGELLFHLFGFPVTNTILASWITTLLLLGFSIIVTRSIKLVPDRRQSFIEMILGEALNFCESIAGKENARRFFPIVTTIFIFVLGNAWIGLIPGFSSILIKNADGELVPLLRGSNTDFNTPLALALISFCIIEFYGFKTFGVGYAKKFISLGELFKGIGLVFTGKVKKGLGKLGTGIINFVVGLLELLTEIARIVSFTFRLFGNMTAGEIVILTVTFLAPFLIADVFYGLELIIGFVQALVFSLLTLIFLSLAVAPHEHGEEEA